ncbi:hypothetical protein OEZ85_008803 [Tetradesmus obliquus]|uniref:Uncharacterized protein n=1 Tax=Tetradesmus obliquus TaxID=3088 RepID=A0ABY8TJV7_TETOB|nr:hypothetical protein OEZ85_008803 [Tetradesmus obliquus]
MALQLQLRKVAGSNRLVVASAAQKPAKSVQFCTGKVCKKQGSQQLLKFAQDLGIDELDISDCGCLGNCGNGPSMVVLPEVIMLRHVNTPKDVADILAWQCKVDIPESLLRATELRLAGNMLAMGGDLDEAIDKYKQALAVDPPRGKHMLHSNLSAACLQAGRKEAALQHAREAVALAPKGFHMAHIRLIDALYALGRYKDVADAVAAAEAQDASFKALPEYKTIQQALKKQNVAV